MQTNKKAMQTHIIMLIIISSIMTILILSVLSPFFKNDPADCKLIEYEVVNKCKESKGIGFRINNNGNKLLKFTINGQTSEKYQIPPNDNTKLSYTSEEGNINIVPYLTDFQGNKMECTGKTITVTPERLIKC